MCCVYGTSLSGRNPRAYSYRDCVLYAPPKQPASSATNPAFIAHHLVHLCLCLVWHWLSLLVVGLAGESGPPSLAAHRWWTSRGERASDRRTEEWQLLRECAHRWGRR